MFKIVEIAWCLWITWMVYSTHGKVDNTETVVVGWYNEHLK